ncbi:XdhC family protein [Paenibacillus silvae]|uniref:XdhC/CoxI family protein n=1 Tax=Paenibacillus silvae TaxID=1325358 RepID=A0A2W6Q5C3_9BACL|nr:XdhC/CoxI family protein [Paenibacillus silvae]PZT52473.1 XdhC/CoxI family protein [Paenibacillus silvae]
MEMHDLCAIAMREARSVLATAIKVEGHAYRKQGVSMLLTEDGCIYGSISPGCLESDLQERVSGVLETGQLELVAYDMRPEDDLSWGETIGCGGLVIVLLEPVRGELRTMMQQMRLCLDTGASVSLIRSFDEDWRGVKYACARLDSGQGPLVPIKRDKKDRNDRNDRNDKKNRSDRDKWNLPQKLTSVYVPKPRLIIIGAGNDVMPVVKLSRLAGFRVLVTDWRESLCTAERFPEAELMSGFPQEVCSQLNIHDQDYILLMSHQFPREREWLALLENHSYTYLGIMGSRTRTARLLDGMPPLKHVHSPVGLSIGADGPEEIAISIAAELIACRRKMQKDAGIATAMIEKGSDAYANDRYRSGSW